MRSVGDVFRSLLNRFARRARRAIVNTAEPRRDSQEFANSVWNERYSKTDAAGQLEHAECDPLDYTRHTFIYNHAIAEPLTGQLDRFWLDDLCDRYLTPRADVVLSLGCGTAMHEEHLLRRGAAERIIAYDMSSEAIAAARRRLAGSPWSDHIDLRCGDPLAHEIPSASIDVILVEAAIHHFVNIVPMFELMHRILKRDGLLVYDEYVGGDHHQHPPELLALINRINGCIAACYKRDFETGAIREQVDAAPLDWMLSYDPTEGVHASQILPLTYRYFDVVERRDYGGAILRPFFSRILHNWDFADPKDQTVARLIILLEQELTRRGAIPTHQTLVVARRRQELRECDPAAIDRVAYADWRPPA